MQTRSPRVTVPSYFIGLLSGTSMDAIDAALVEILDGQVRVMDYRQTPYASGLRDALRFARDGRTMVDLRAIGALDAQLGRAFADAALELLAANSTAAARIAAIGSHGQTVLHQPAGDTPFSIQLGNPNIIAALTDIVTVADFRRMDMAVGGQGAPLAPGFHAAVFRRDDADVAVLNLGGIANVTVLPAQPRAAVLGFDTGPANALLDAWAERHLGRDYDDQGQWGDAGSCSMDLLRVLLQEPYFEARPPKSTGRELFNVDWLEQRLGPQPPGPQDVQATLLELTSTSIAQALHRHAAAVSELLVCGGGVHNTALMRRLGAALPGVNVASSATRGVSPDAVEAAAFAWLAHRRLAGLAGNLPSVTGAREPAVLGAVYSPPARGGDGDRPAG